MWAVYDNSFIACERAVDRLEAGQYTIVSTQDKGIVFNKKNVNLDSFIALPDSSTTTILSEIETFWNKESVYRQFGFLWKRGVLLYGPPGSGKTTTVQLLSKMIVDRDGISVYIDNPKIGAYGLDLLRRIEPKRPVIVILEDIDAICSRYEEADLLSLLDGELQIDNVVFVATTNYPQKLDPRIINRPSRFDIVRKIPMPSAEARKVFILEKNPDLAHRFIESTDSDAKSSIEDAQDTLASASDYVKSVDVRELKKNLKAAVKAGELTTIIEDSIKSYEDTKASIPELKAKIKALKASTPKKIPEIDLWVDKTEGYSVAHLKELIIAVECFGRPLDEAARRLTAMLKSRPNSAEYLDSVGFD